MMDAILIQCPACRAKNRIPAEKRHLRPKCGRCGRSLADVAPGTVLEIDDRGLEKLVRESVVPVVVDMYSPTCGPCQMLAPIIEAVAEKFAGTILVAKLDTSRHQLAAARLQIRGVPTLLFFKDGDVVDRIVGAAPRAQIEQSIRALL